MSMTLLSALAPLAEGGGFEPPSVEEFFPDPLLFAGTPFAINRVILVRLIAAVALCTILLVYSRRARLVPRRAQNAVEMLLDFSRKNVGEQILEERAGPYQPLLATIFLGVLFMDITGIIPGLQIAGTSLIGMPLVYAVVAYIAFIVAGCKAQGTGHFFRSQLFPPGVPKLIYLLMTPIELISTFVIRPLTLTVRLLANMVSGHLLLVLCFLGTNALYFSMGGVGGLALGTVTLLGGIVFTAFEAFIAALQAYIFALLTAAYIALSLESH